MRKVVKHSLEKKGAEVGKRKEEGRKGMEKEKTERKEVAEK